MQKSPKFGQSLALVLLLAPAAAGLVACSASAGSPSPATTGSTATAPHAYSAIASRVGTVLHYDVFSGTMTSTKVLTVTAARIVSGGTEATETVVRPNQPVQTINVLVHTDGSESVPLSAKFVGKVPISMSTVGAGITFPYLPSQPVGKTITQHLLMKFASGSESATVPAAALFDVVGTRSVTVPSGTYTTIEFTYRLSVTVGGTTIVFAETNYAAAEVGIVEGIESDTIAGHREPTVTDKLASIKTGAGQRV